MTAIVATVNHMPGLPTGPALDGRRHNPGMAKPEVLSRVDADLARGDTRLATRRLAGLLGADPQDLEVRARLADTYRRAGDLPEAGRWGFLTEDTEPHEVAAFVRKHPSPADRLRVLRLRGENPRGLGPLAGPRYADLVAAAAADVRPPVPPASPAPPADTAAVERARPAPAPLGADTEWSLSDILLALALFGPPVVAVCGIIYEIVEAVRPFGSP
jgi:hypothetical protein